MSCSKTLPVQSSMHRDLYDDGLTGDPVWAFRPSNSFVVIRSCALVNGGAFSPMLSWRLSRTEWSRKRETTMLHMVAGSIGATGAVFPNRLVAIRYPIPHGSLFISSLNSDIHLLLLSLMALTSLWQGFTRGFIERLCSSIPVSGSRCFPPLAEALGAKLANFSSPPVCRLTQGPDRLSRHTSIAPHSYETHIFVDQSLNRLSTIIQCQISWVRSILYCLAECSFVQSRRVPPLGRSPSCDRRDHAHLLDSIRRVLVSLPV